MKPEFKPIFEPVRQKMWIQESQEVNASYILDILSNKKNWSYLIFFYLNFFRYCFPFGRPEGALKATLSLLERVLMKDIVTPILPEEVRGMIKKSLETAALVNYTRLSGEARIEGTINVSRWIINNFSDYRGS